VTRKWFEGLLKELTERFGGATSFIRAPGQGLWDDGQDLEEDDIAVVEVMTDTLEEPYWQQLKTKLEQELDQDELVIRAQSITKL
jgi:hypothetical protein